MWRNVCFKPYRNSTGGVLKILASTAGRSDQASNQAKCIEAFRLKTLFLPDLKFNHELSRI